MKILFFLMFTCVGLVLALQKAPAAKSVPPAGSTLRIVKDSLMETDTRYFVKGSIYNPNSRAVKNVVIKYQIWKKFIGKDGHGSLIKADGGLETALIKYMPPKQTVDFTTDDNASIQLDAKPDPISAEIAAEWDSE